MAKMCCDCCLLGLMTASQNSSCDFQGFSPGRQCLDTAKGCCEKYTTDMQPTTNEIELSTVQRCCQEGRDLALAGANCTATSPISSSNTCNISMEQCCSAAVIKTPCDKGIKMAEWQGACETPFFQGEPWEIQISKTCCDCCALGLMTASRSSSCNFHGLFLLETCLHTARACCEKRSTAENKPIENEMELRAVQSCCQDGRHRAYLGQPCTTLSFFSSSYSCSITKEQCCSAAVGEWFCYNGTELAKDKGTCDGLLFPPEARETQMAKMCCDCCLLGLMTASQNSSCDFQGFSPGRQCLDTAKGCCEKYTTDMQPTTNEIELSTVQRCCQEGRDLALAGANCTATSPISSSNTCNISMEQCCSAAVIKTPCDKGIKMAEWQGACETPFFQGEPWEIQISKTCCDCCALGLMTASRSSSCNFHGLFLLETCLHTARACCEKRSTAENKPIENEMELRAVQSCCQDGRHRAYLGQPCTTLSFFSSSYSCSITKEQCCSAAVGEWFCYNGTELAKDKGTCDGLLFPAEARETQMAKMCCDCCLLGLMTARQNSSCDFQGFSPGRQCLDTAKGCCEKKNTTDMQPTTNDIELSTVQRCCQEGRDLALAGANCTATSPISSSNTCNISMEQCCSAAVIKTPCDKGIKMAEWQGACETPFFQGEPWEIQISKTCCDCCALGLMTASRSSSCNFHGLFLLETCLHTARACCEKRSTAENKPIENEMELRAVQTCCQDGRHRAHLGQDCTNLSFSSTSYSCSITKEQCCSAAVGEWFCYNGIQLAKDKGTCDGLSSKAEHWEFQIAKMCCDCCLLGLMTARQNSSCDFQGFSPGRQCLDTAKGCCEKYTTDVQPTSNVPVTESLNFTWSPDKVDCRDLNCSQLCKGNGTCACLAGYELQNDGVNCQDVDECRTRNVCGDHACVNLVGTYRCGCRIGFIRFNSLTRQCEDIDECAWPAGGHKCSYSCSNVPGSFYCTCPTTGYTLAQNGHTCQDIDECAAGTHTCSLRESCFNILGGFRCLSLTCPQYFYLAEQGKDTSASWTCFKFCYPQDVSCYNYPIKLIGYISLSLPTVRVISEPKEIILVPSTLAANNVHRSSGTEVFFNILVADEHSSFDVIKRSYKDVPFGVLRQLKPLRGPKDFVYQVAVTKVKSGVVSHRSIVVIRFFISEFWF
ncbi:uncharacterized protein AB9W97_006881 [Spinachia spinachia]